MIIGIVINNTDVANHAIKSFYESIIESLKKNANILIVENIEMYSENIDFTIGIGRYNFYIDNTPAYEYFKIHHYNWVLDNPLKLNLDTNSIYISHIMIDNEFNKIMKFNNNNLFLPLGTNLPNKLERAKNQKKENDVVFIGQIRNHNLILKDIKLLHLDIRSKVLKIIDKMCNNLNQSFIACFNNVIKNKNISSFDKKIIFKYSNSYIRAYKRYIVLNSIKDHTINIIGDVKNPLLHKKKNIIIYPPVPYSYLKHIYSNSKISININPNFNHACHDRIINSIAFGSLCLTDTNRYIDSFFKNKENILLFNYNNTNNIDETITVALENKNFIQMQKSAYCIVEKNFTWDNILLRLLDYHVKSK